MIICAHCHASQMNGSVFCGECGASLLGTAPLDIQQPHISAAPAKPTVGTRPLDPQSPTLLLRFSTGESFTLDLRSAALVGRTDREKGIVPDLDLAPFGGYDAGVSRRHATLTARAGIALVEDLGSANGTFVNGTRLAANIPTPLHIGDELRFASLVIRVGT